MDTSCTTQMTEFLGNHWRWYFSNEIKIGHPLADCCGKNNSRKFYWNLDGEKEPDWDCLFVHRNQGIFLSVNVDDTKKWLERSRIWLQVEEIDEKHWSWRTNFISWSRILGCTQRECNRMKLLLRNTHRCLNHVFLLEQLKSCQGGRSLTQSLWHGPTTWKDMLDFALSETVNWQTRKWSKYYKVSSPCLDDHQFKQEEPGSVGELSQVCSQTVLKLFVLVTNWKTDILWSVNKLARAVTKMDSGMRQTIGKTDFIHSSHIWIQTVLSCGQHCSALCTWFMSRLRLCWRPWRLKNLLRVESCVSLEAEHLSPSVGCARETNVSIGKQHCKTWWTSPRRLVRDKRPFHRWKQNQNTNRKGKARYWAIVKCGLRTLQHTFFWRRVSVVHFWTQRSCHQDEYQRTKSNNETCVPEPTELRLIVVWQNQSGTKDPNQICKHQKSTCRHANQSKFHAWRVEPSSSFVQHHEFLDVLLAAISAIFFWSDRKAERHVKRGQETSSSEGSPMAEPKPTVQATARPVNLVLRSPWSARENLS